MNFSGPIVEQISDITMIFGMIMHHAIRNNFDIGSSSISCIKVAREGGEGMLHPSRVLM